MVVDIYTFRSSDQIKRKLDYMYINVMCSL